MVTYDIIIPVHGRTDLFARTLESISISDDAGGLQNIIVIENGGAQGARKICEQASAALPVRYFYEEQASLTLARNRGVAESESDFLIFLDSDVRVVPGALSAYRDAFQRSQGKEFFGGPLYPEYEREPAAWLRDFLPWSMRGHTLGSTDMEVQRPVFLGGNFAVPREACRLGDMFEGPGAEGSSGGGVGEETRLQQRLLDSGFKGVYLSGAGVIHPVPLDKCNSRFVLNRTWRHGHTEGALAAQEMVWHRITFGAPFFFWRRAASSFVRMMLIFNPFASKRERFRKILKFWRDAAAVRGFQRAENMGRARR